MHAVERKNMITKKSLLDLYSELSDYCSGLEARISILEQQNSKDTLDKLFKSAKKQPRTKDGKFAKKK